MVLDVSLSDVVAACAARLGDAAPRVLGRIGGPLGAGARGSLAQVAGEANQRRRAEIAAVVRSVPPPPGALRTVHPTWIEDALAASPPRTRTALVAPPRAPIDVWLARRVTASLSLWPMTADDGLPRDPALVLGWLRAVAHDQLAFALGPAATGVPALREAAARITRSPRAGALGPHRAAVTRCRGAALDDERALVVIAARALAPHRVQWPHAVRALSCRLPVGIGAVFARELDDNRAIPVENVPTWAALVGR